MSLIVIGSFLEFSYDFLIIGILESVLIVFKVMADSNFWSLA